MSNLSEWWQDVGCLAKTVIVLVTAPIVVWLLVLLWPFLLAGMLGAVTQVIVRFLLNRINLNPIPDREFRFVINGLLIWMWVFSLLAGLFTAVAYTFWMVAISQDVNIWPYSTLVFVSFVTCFAFSYRRKRRELGMLDIAISTRTAVRNARREMVEAKREYWREKRMLIREDRRIRWHTFWKTLFLGTYDE